MTNYIKINKNILNKINYINQMMTDFYIDQNYNNNYNLTYNKTRYAITITGPTTIEIELIKFIDNNKTTKIIKIDFESEFNTNIDTEIDYNADLFHYLNYNIRKFNNDPEYI